MKKQIIILSYLLFIAAEGRAQDTLKIQPTPEKPSEQLRQIRVDELPEVIKEKLAGDDYSSWILHAAYEKPPADLPDSKGSEAAEYVVELRSERDTIRVRFDNDGNRREN